MYSTIKRKTCKCGCSKYPSLSYAGYSFSCAPQDVLDKVGNKRKVAAKNKNKRLLDVRKLRIVQDKVNVGNELELWFILQRKEMTGFCSCGCGEKSSKDDDKYFKFSCGHVLLKSKFKSIATHPENCIELAFWTGCHSVLDDKGYEYCQQTKPILWTIIVQKFKILYPFIAVSERRFIPEILLNTL